MKGISLKSVKNLGRIGLRAANQNLPTILSGFAIAGLIATAWTSFKAAPEVKSAIDGAKWNKAEGDIDAEVKLNTWETFTAVAPHIWKPVACGVFAAGCVIGAQVLNMQRLTMLAGAYKLSEKKLKEYEEKAKEFLGEEKVEEIRKEATKEEMQAAWNGNSAVIQTPHTGLICYDPWSGRYFTSNEATLRRAESCINRELTSGSRPTLNDFYDELDLDHTKVGDVFCWDAWCDGYEHVMKLMWDHEAVDLNGEVTVVYALDYKAGIDRDFR